MYRLCCSLVFLLSISVFSFVSTEVINYQNCPDSVDVCSVDQVRVNPCPQAAQNGACHIRRRRPAEMSFDFTPKFDADNLVASLGWVVSDTVELPLVTLERDACKAATCPIRNGVKTTYTINVPIEPKFPVNTYTIRWALKDPVTEKRCCFTIEIKVVR